jgi:hypothetical protein
MHGTTLAAELKRLIPEAADQGGTRSIAADDLFLTIYPSSVVNVRSQGRDLILADVEAVRAALTAAGYRESESWVAWQGVSWLSPGVMSGVSIRAELRP